MEMLRKSLGYNAALANNALAMWMVVKNEGDIPFATRPRSAD